MRYPNYKGRYDRTRGDYTLIVSDMIDNSTTDNINYGYGYFSSDGLKDEVSGYTIKQIENVLSYTSSWDNWRDNIKNKYSNATKNKLDKLFKNWD